MLENRIIYRQKNIHIIILFYIYVIDNIKFTPIKFILQVHMTRLLFI